MEGPLCIATVTLITRKTAVLINQSLAFFR